MWITASEGDGAGDGGRDTISSKWTEKSEDGGKGGTQQGGVC